MAAALQVTGDSITLAAEQKARTTYDNILRVTDGPDVRNAIKFLREREVVHYQRFGEGLRIITDRILFALAAFSLEKFYQFYNRNNRKCEEHCGKILSCRYFFKFKRPRKRRNKYNNRCKHK